MAVLSPRGAIKEYYEEPKHANFKVGDIYIGSVKKINKNLNAAFVDIGHEKDAFLHYLDLGPAFVSMAKYVKRLRRSAGSSKITEVDLCLLYTSDAADE